MGSIAIPILQSWKLRHLPEACSASGFGWNKAALFHVQLVRGGEAAATLPLGFPCGSAASAFIIRVQEGVPMLPGLDYPNPYLLGGLSIQSHA